MLSTSEGRHTWSGWLLHLPCFPKTGFHVMLKKSFQGFPGDPVVNSKEISPEYSLEGLILKLKLQYFGHLM